MGLDWEYIKRNFLHFLRLDWKYIKRIFLHHFVNYLSRRSTGKDHCLAEPSRLFYSGSESQQEEICVQSICFSLQSGTIAHWSSTLTSIDVELDMASFC